MKISRCLRPVLLAACALALPLTACKKSAPEFSPDVQAALQDMEPDGEEEAWHEVLDCYRETGDPNAASADGEWCFLSLACADGKLDLAKALLRAGATVQVKNGFSPLMALLTCNAAEIDEDEFIALLDLLVQHGANLREQVGDLSVVAFAAANNGIAENVILHLMDQGASLGEDAPSQLLTVAVLAAQARNTALRRAIAAKTPLADASGSALHALSADTDTIDHAETLSILLAAGADINALDEEGKTPILRYLETFGEEVTEDQRECLRLMLEHGASLTEPTAQDATYGEVCAYDFLAAHADVTEELREEGFDIPDLPIVIREDEKHLSGDLRRAELRLSTHPLAEEQLKPHIPLLAKVLTQHLYGADGEMAGAAFSLLCKGDKGLAEQILPHLPFWTDYKEWELQQETQPVGVVFLSLLTEAENDEPTFLTLPKDGILHAAAMLNEHGDTMQAMDMAELLEYAPDAEEDIERLCKDDSTPALQLGAMTAKLHRADLPDARVGSVEAWLGDYNPACLPPAVMKALHLTNLETFWFGDMDATERAAIVADMESLGLYTVADIYRKALLEGLTDDELADIMGEAAEHAIELELATLRFIWENRKDFEASKK